MQQDLQSEIKHLHTQILEKKIAFDEGMKRDMEFEHLKKIFVEIRELEKRLENCFEHSSNPEEYLHLSIGLKPKRVG
jgi:hypothetical protein